MFCFDSLPFISLCRPPRPPTPPAFCHAAAEEMPPKKRNREEEEGKAAVRVPHPLFNDSIDSDPDSSNSSTNDDDSDYDPEDFTEDGLIARAAVLTVSKSVVALASSIDGDPLPTFACTGSVVAHEGSASWIITSAALIRKRGSDADVHKASDVKIEVLLHSKKVVEGQLLMYNLQYNIAVVSIECEAEHLPAVPLTDLPDSYFMAPKLVVAIAREFGHQGLQMKRGKILRDISKLDCNELMVSTCRIKQSFIGGLLMDLERRIVGMNFIDEETTPFLPVEVVGRCLKHFRKFGDIKQPWLGIRGRALHMLKLAKLEEIWHKYPMRPSGILVEMIPEVSSANCGGIGVGDIVSQLDGAVLHSVAQLSAMLLDKMEVAMYMQKPVVLQAVIQRPRDCTTFVANVKIELPSGECDMLFKNRWELRLPNERTERRDRLPLNCIVGGGGRIRTS